MDRRHVLQQLPVLLRQGPAEAGQLQVSKFFNTGKLNHELKFSFNYRQQIADSATGWPGDQNLGSGVRVLVLEHGACSRAACGRSTRTSSGAARSATRSRAGNLTVQLGVRYDQQQAKNLPGPGLREHDVPGPAPGGHVPRRRRLAVRLHELAAARFGDLRPRREEEHARCGPRTRSLPTSSGSSATTRAACRYPTATTTTGPTSTTTTSSNADEVDLDSGALRLLQRHRSGHAAERPEPDPAGPEGTQDQRVHVRRRPAVHRHPRRVGDLQLPHHEQSHPAVADGYDRDDWELADRTHCRRQRQPGHACHGVQRLHDHLRRAVLRPYARRRSPPASRSPTAPGQPRGTTAWMSRSSNDCRTTGCCGATSAGTASSST